VFFNFIKYTQPSWQFNLVPSLEGCFASCYISEDECAEELLDQRYETKGAQLADAGYLLWNRGALLKSTKEQIQKISSSKPSLKDEYIFIRKYWGSAWAAFVLIRRITSLKNPFKELKYYFATRSVEKIDVFNNANPYDDYTSFQSALILINPLVAVIIPTLNRYKYLQDALHDLEKQSYRNFEVIIVDQSENFDRSFYNQFDLQLKVIHQKEKLLWTARNKAIKSTTAEYLLFFDDDSRVSTDWIEQHLKCIDFFNAQISAGVSFAVAGQKISASYNFFRWADQFDSGNAMVKREVMRAIGLFDEQFNGQRMGDAEFAYRAYMKGVQSISNPKAHRIHLKVSEGGLREMGSWDGFRPKKWFAPKPIPSVIYLYKKYLPKPLYKSAVLLGLMLSNVPYKYKRSSSMLTLSVVLTILKSPLLFIQYSRSLNIAKSMLRRGAMDNN
jgi:glycosyltransferase involved in cell wall biosynthesis